MGHLPKLLKVIVVSSSVKVLEILVSTMHVVVVVSMATVHCSFLCWGKMVCSGIKLLKVWFSCGVNCSAFSTVIVSSSNIKVLEVFVLWWSSSSVKVLEVIVFT